MKSQFQARLLQHLISNKKNNEGFTLIELLVVIIIIGILSAIALPSFLNQAAKAKQSEAKNYVGAVNRAQQAFRIENPEFAGTVADLEIGIPTETVDYKYTIDGNDAVSTTFTGTPTDPNSLKIYQGGVVVMTNGQTSAASCQSEGTDAATDVAVGLDTGTGATCTTGEPMR